MEVVTFTFSLPLSSEFERASPWLEGAFPSHAVPSALREASLQDVTVRKGAFHGVIRESQGTLEVQGHLRPPSVAAEAGVIISLAFLSPNKC